MPIFYFHAVLSQHSIKSFRKQSISPVLGKRPFSTAGPELQSSWEASGGKCRQSRVRVPPGMEELWREQAWPAGLACPSPSLNISKLCSSLALNPRRLHFFPLYLKVDAQALNLRNLNLGPQQLLAVP